LLWNPALRILSVKRRARDRRMGSGTESSGKPFAEHLRWTDTWMKTPSGKWQVVATQYTPVKG
jgi:hypothetical protein